MGLELVVSYKSDDNSIYNSKDYKEKIKEKIKFLLINTYIDRNVIKPEITEEAIKDFYNDIIYISIRRWKNICTAFG